MVEYSGKYYCRLLTPTGIVFEDRVGSVILPCHDGMAGILRNHCPMLCKLGEGILYIQQIDSRDNFACIIEGGFARISENNLTILAYDVVNFEQMDPSQRDELVMQARQQLTASEYISRQRQLLFSNTKARLIVKLAKLHGLVPA